MQRKKRYGVDLDGTVFAFDKAFAEWLKNERGVEVDISKLTHWDWHKCFDNVSKEMFKEEYVKFCKANGFSKLEPIDDAADGLRKLVKHGEVYIITARPDYTYVDTIECLMREVDLRLLKNVIIAYDKASVVNKLNIDVVIDDGPHIAESIVLGTSAKMYLVDKPYNQHINYDEITRVNSWKQFLSYEGLEWAS